MLGAIRSMFHREYIKKEAVQDISFSIAPGEMVGYIGPNGAGKSTTIKMLTGILVPSSGKSGLTVLSPIGKAKMPNRSVWLQTKINCGGIAHYRFFYF